MRLICSLDRRCRWCRDPSANAEEHDVMISVKPSSEDRRAVGLAAVEGLTIRTVVILVSDTNSISNTYPELPKLPTLKPSCYSSHRYPRLNYREPSFTAYQPTASYLLLCRVCKELPDDNGSWPLQTYGQCPCDL